MVEVKNGEFLKVSEVAFKKNDNSVFFNKMKEEHYDCFDKNVNCNYRFYKRLGKPKAERRSWDNNEEVYTYFNITKSPAFNYTYFDYESGEALQIRLLEAKQPLMNNTTLIFEIIFSDVKDKKHIIKDYEYVPSFNGTQSQRIKYYQKCFEKYCEDYTNGFLEEKTFKVFKILILKIAYKELFNGGKAKNSYDGYSLNEKTALRIFDVFTGLNALNKDKYVNLFNQYENSQAYNYINFFTLERKYKKQLANIFKILNSSKDGNDLIDFQCKFTYDVGDKLPQIYAKIDTFIKEHRDEF